MTDQPAKTLLEETQQDSQDIALLKRDLNESTGLTWLWSILFGPIYFWVHSFTGAGFVVLVVAIPTLGLSMLLLNPWLAYKCWRDKAESKAETRLMMAKR
ncbi:hypothetical protein [Shimia sp. MIT910701]|uniref:hypothetical protein n=1 Tax=Shimia sp. MIT910701 TaxID=3096987 RepID=UPI00399BAC50